MNTSNIDQVSNTACSKIPDDALKGGAIYLVQQSEEEDQPKEDLVPSELGLLDPLSEALADTEEASNLGPDAAVGQC